MAQTFSHKSADQVHGVPADVASAHAPIDQNIRIAEELVRALEQQSRTVEQQDVAVRQAYERGWAECAESLSYIGSDMWTAGVMFGRLEKEREVNARWAEVAARSHFLGSPLSRTHAEKRAEELEGLKPRPADFVGLEHDPQYIERCRASVESITRNRSQRAA